MRIRFSPESVEDLKRLHDFLALHDPEVSRSTVLNLKSAINRFAEMPHIGRPLEEIEGVREFVFGRYVVRYLVKTEAVYILRFWHSKESR
ncbi:type II toxin-antitoxin system RelE/ParE family toxin [Paucidesulfovibrio longus]|uniref:type II toxin-antitoxin system RelE/ParE family toxin n=1 Tax=Paucidesulfovibrio longus TaxID=889 RepID=UPI0003B5BBCE|nr:type II toxin-antitoxin system RelE/ParE family toxin [Paucidesulfovibrio longus]